MRRIPFVAAGLLLLCACRDDSSGNHNNVVCPTGFESRDEACVPVFDNCTGPAEISELGGGCRAVGVPTTLYNVAVSDTRPNAQGSWDGLFGQGIWAICDDRTGDCGTLSVTSCLVDSSHSGGVAVEGVSGFMAASEVRSVLAQPLDGKYGYGIQIGGREDQSAVDLPSFDVTACRFRDAKLSGLLYYRARGTLTGSQVSGGENSVVMNEGSSPTILDDNSLTGTVEDAPTWANLFPSPSPSPPPALP